MVAARFADVGRFLQGYFWNGEWMIPLYLLVLGVLQLLCVIWLFDIAKGVYAFVVSRGRAGNLTKNFSLLR